MSQFSVRRICLFIFCIKLQSTKKKGNDFIKYTALSFQNGYNLTFMLHIIFCISIKCSAFYHKISLRFRHCPYLHDGFPGGSNGKESTCDVGELGSIPGWRRSPEKGKSNPLQYSFLGNPMDRGAWQATVMGSQKSQTQ